MIVHKTIILTIIACIINGCSNKNNNYECNKLSKSLLSKKYPNELAQEGIIALKKIDLKRASKIFNQALQFRNKNSSLHFFNALTYHFISNKYDPGMIAYARLGYLLSSQYNRNNWWAHLFSGILEFENGNFQLAQKYFSTALLIDDSNLIALLGLSVSSYYLSDFDIAEISISKAIQLSNNSPEVHKKAAIIYAAAHKKSLAFRSFNIYKKQERVTGEINLINNKIHAWLKTNNKIPPNKAVLSKQAQPRKQKKIGSKKENTKANVSSQQDGEKNNNFNINDGISNNADKDFKAFNLPDISEELSQDNSSNSASKDKPTQKISLYDNNQISVEAMFIMSENISAVNKGINILENLHLSLSYKRKQSKVKFPRISELNDISNNFSFSPSFAEIPHSRVVESNISIPEISYMLNIFNDSTLRHRIISNPSVIIANNKTARLFSGGGILLGISGVNASTTKSLELGIALKITPKFIDDSTISAEIIIEKDFPSQSALSAGSFKEQLSRNRNVVSSNIIMGLDQTLILGSVDEKNIIEIKEKTSFLGRLPILGNLFGKTSSTNNTKSMLVLITLRNARKTTKETHNQYKRSPQLLSLLENWGIGTNNLSVYKFGYNMAQIQLADLQFQDWKNPTFLDSVINVANLNLGG